MPISLIRGGCRICGYAATVGVGPDEEATTAILWTAARCPSCGLVAVNACSARRGQEIVCHECGSPVMLYDRVGKLPLPREGHTCPACNQHGMSFATVEPPDLPHD